MIVAVDEFLRFFEGIFPHAGRIRDYNITKNEWVLKGATVLYASAASIRDTLDYDFSQEKNFNYRNISLQQTLKHMVAFVSGVWQIHAFGEGNTRTTAVFTIKYLRTLGFKVDNNAFSDNSWYFRNALVRANYNDIQHGVFATTEYLERFFGNLLLGENNELRNRDLLIGAQDGKPVQSANEGAEIAPKCKICTLNCSLEEITVLQYLQKHPGATQKQIAAHIGKSERSVKTITADLSKRGIIERKNGRRNGFWELKVEL